MYRCEGDEERLLRRRERAGRSHHFLWLFGALHTQNVRKRGRRERVRKKERWIEKDDGERKGEGEVQRQEQEHKHEHVHELEKKEHEKRWMIEV